MTHYTINQELNGIEISFDSKPEAATLEALKAAGYRWHRVKKLWYAKNSAARLSLAESIATGKEQPSKVENPEVINLDNLGIKPDGFSYYGSYLAKLIREDLKRRGVKGVTVRARKITYDTGITVTIKATAEDIASVEEYKERYSFDFFSCDADRGFYNGEKWVYNFHELTDEQKREEYEKCIRYKLSHVSSFSTHWTDRKHNPELTTAFYNKCVAVLKIADQWNYDKSDLMSDYFDVGYYLDIDIKKTEDFQPRENMTEGEKADYEDEKRKEEEAFEEWQRQREKEEEEARNAREAYEAQRKIDREVIENNIKVDDLGEEDQLYITGLVGGIGKSCNIEELDLEIAENPNHREALITRKVTFSNEEAFAAFSKYLLDDFDFLSGKGGTATDDIRIDAVENALYRLTEEQRQTVKFYMCDCVAVYVGEELRLVCNPEGYTYSRYTYKPTEKTEIKNGKKETEKQRKESESKPAFYFPEDVEEQANKLHEGQKITVYQCDGWNLCSVYGGFGTVSSVKPGTWAQYNGVHITLSSGGKAHDIFIRDGKKCLIYNGIKPLLPDSVTRRRITDNMSELLNENELFPAILDYYGKQGEHPIIDTIQR